MSNESTPRPWTFDLKKDANSHYAIVLDADGNVIVDTFNSEVALIQEEHDADENGPTCYRWDARGKANAELIVRAVNRDAAFETALKEIRDNETKSPCGCEDHSNPECCAQVGYHCPECIAGAALALAEKEG